jgi:hypothetical protein
MGFMVAGAIYPDDIHELKLKGFLCFLSDLQSYHFAHLEISKCIALGIQRAYRPEVQSARSVIL